MISFQKFIVFLSNFGTTTTDKRDLKETSEYILIFLAGSFVFSKLNSLNLIILPPLDFLLIFQSSNVTTVIFGVEVLAFSNLHSVSVNFLFLFTVLVVALVLGIIFALKNFYQFHTGSTRRNHMQGNLQAIKSEQLNKHNTHICRIKGCGGAGCPPPPPIIFERLKLPQQIIYRRKENLSESPNHQKYWENILVSRFYKQFSRNRRNLGHFRKFEKISNS